MYNVHVPHCLLHITVLRHYQQVYVNGETLDQNVLLHVDNTDGMLPLHGNIAFYLTISTYIKCLSFQHKELIKCMFMNVKKGSGKQCRVLI